MTTKKTLEDDPLLILTSLPRTLAVNKIVQKISYFYYGFVLITLFGSVLVTLINKESHLFFGQYSAFISGMTVGLASYITMYHDTYVNIFWNIYYDILPSLWPLRSLGNQEFDKFQKLSKITIILLTAIIVLALTASTIGLPWFENLYNFLLPVKVAMDYFDGWFLKSYLIIFYSSFYHISLTIVANVCYLTYVVLHLYNQLCMLNVRLRNLSDGPDWNQAFEDLRYQDFVTIELVSCIKLHQLLLRYTQEINSLIYYPTFYHTTGGILIGLSLILFPITTIQDVLRVGFIALSAVCVTVAFCILGQLLYDESEEIFTSACNTPWYLWNTENRKLLCLFVLKTQKQMVLSSSGGIITINYRLLIGIFRAIYSTLTFVLNVSKSLNLSG